MVEKIVQIKRKLGYKKQNLFKKTSIKYTCPILASKCFVIIGILFLSIIWHIAITPQKKLFNSPISKYKTKVTLIIHITEAINTLKYNVRQARQIEDSPSSSKDKVRY